MRRRQKGFSLIELLIVVAIILIIAAIAIPNLLRSRMAANESSAVGSLRTINTAEVTFSTTYPTVGFAALSALGGSVSTCARSASGTATSLPQPTTKCSRSSGRLGPARTAAPRPLGSVEGERRVLVGEQREVRVHANAPPHHLEHEVAKPFRPPWR